MKPISIFTNSAVEILDAHTFIHGIFTKVNAVYENTMVPLELNVYDFP